MRWINRWMGLETLFVQVGHGLVGAALLGIVAANVPWWFLLAITPLIALSLLFWLYESSLALPVARRLMAGEQAGTSGPGGGGSLARRNRHSDWTTGPRGTKCLD